MDLRYTYYLLKLLSLSNMNADSAIQGLNRNIVDAMKINVPFLQQQIASSKKNAPL